MSWCYTLHFHCSGLLVYLFSPWYKRIILPQDALNQARNIDFISTMSIELTKVIFYSLPIGKKYESPYNWNFLLNSSQKFINGYSKFLINLNCLQFIRKKNFLKITIFFKLKQEKMAYTTRKKYCEKESFSIYFHFFLEKKLWMRCMYFLRWLSFHIHPIHEYLHPLTTSNFTVQNAIFIHEPSFLLLVFSLFYKYYSLPFRFASYRARRSS